GGGSQGNRMVSCTGCDKHDNVNHKLSAAAGKKIRDWCERGGYLFTQDWALCDVSEDWAKKYAQRPVGTHAGGKIAKQGKMMKSKVVPVSPSRGKTSHPLLRGVFIDPNVPAAPPEGGDGAAGGEGGTVERNPGIPPGVKIERKWTIDDDSPYIDIVDKNQVV